MRIAKVARFYGWPLSEILELDIHTFQQVYNAIAPLEAHEFLVTLKTFDWPNMKDAARTKLHAKMKDVAYNSIKGDKTPKKKISNEELAKILSKR